MDLSSRFGIAPSGTASAIKRPNQHQFPKEKHGLLGAIDCFRMASREKKNKMCRVFDAECMNLSSRFGIDSSGTASAIEHPNQHQFPKEKHGLLGAIDCFRMASREKKNKMCRVFDAECMNLSSRFGIDSSGTASAIECPNQHQYLKEKCAPVRGAFRMADREKKSPTAEKE